MQTNSPTTTTLCIGGLTQQDMADLLQVLRVFQELSLQRESVIQFKERMLKSPTTVFQDEQDLHRLILAGKVQPQHMFGAKHIEQLSKLKSCRAFAVKLQKAITRYHIANPQKPNLDGIDFSLRCN